MLELNVNAKSPASITAALKKVKEMVMTGAVDNNTTLHIVLEPGTYQESIKYNMSNPLIIESVPGTNAKDCVIQADNCESYNPGRENRAVCVFGPSAKSITLKNFSIINTHKKSISEKNTKPDSAEALVWNNENGILLAHGMNFEGRQNTLFVKGWSWFYNCYVNGDTDFIYGEPALSVFEESIINTRDDNRGDYNGYAVKCRTQIGKKGFVFSSCTFTGSKRKKSDLYVYRTAGLGCAETGRNFDNVAFLNCTVSENYSPEFEWDDDMNLKIYPRGNVEFGIREYGTKELHSDGTISEADTSRRNIRSYTLTNEEYFKNYASRFLIMTGTPLANFLD